MKAQQAVRLAWQHHTIVPAFNIPYLPMAKPVAQAIIDEKTVAMLQVARLEWEKFEAQSLEAVAEEYFKYYDPKYTLLHLDHVPVIDEDQKRVDYMPILERAVKAGYQSVMVDGSRLSLAENIAVTKQVADFAHANDIACEVTGIPLVLHGGSGINNQCILDGIANGIAKINVGTEIRQTYERTLGETNDVEKARAAVYTRTCEIIRSFRIEGNQEKLFG